MTKVSIFGAEPIEKKELKKIELVKFLHTEGSLPDASSHPSDFDNVSLIKRGDFDVIKVWNDPKEHAEIYLGHWNDGVI